MEEVIRVELVDENELNPFHILKQIGVFILESGEDIYGNHEYKMIIETKPEYTKDKIVTVYPVFDNRIEISSHSLTMGLYHFKREVLRYWEVFDCDYTVIRHIFSTIYMALHPLISADIPNFKNMSNILLKLKGESISAIITNEPIEIYGSTSVTIDRTICGKQTYIQFKSLTHGHLINVEDIKKGDILKCIIDQHKYAVEDVIREYIDLYPQKSKNLRIPDYYNKLDYYILPTNVKVPPTTPLFIGPQQTTFWRFKLNTIENWPTPIKSHVMINNLCSSEDSILNLFTPDKNNTINLTIVIAPKIDIIL